MESANYHLKRELKQRGGRRGHTEETRCNRMKMFAELANGALLVNGGSRIKRILTDLRMYSESLLFLERSTLEESSEEGDE